MSGRKVSVPGSSSISFNIYRKPIKDNRGLYLVFTAQISDKYHVSSDKVAFFLFRKVPRKIRGWL